MTRLPASLRLGAAAFLGAVILAGCGGGNHKSSSGPSTATNQTTTNSSATRLTAGDRTGIKQAIGLYVAGVRRGDARAFCAAFTADQRDFMTNSTDPPAANCVEAARDGLRRIPPQTRAAFRGASVSGITGGSEPDTATATLTVPPNSGPASGDLPVTLERDGDTWRISQDIGAQ